MTSPAPEMRDGALPARHDHVFLGAGHERSERRTWAVIWLCGAMMVAEIGGGALFGSIALVADGLHMSTHAGALLLATLAYSYARKHARDPRFSFGTGKLGDLAGFSSAIILAMIALLIAYEALKRFLAPVPIHFAEAIPIACLGLIVNVTSAWLLSGGSGHADHGHHHGLAHRHGHGDQHHDHDDGAEGTIHPVATKAGVLNLEIAENGQPPRFRLHATNCPLPPTGLVGIETIRQDGAQQLFTMADCGAYLESVEEIPEPHAFTARLRLEDEVHNLAFEEHEHAGGAAHRDNNMRAAIVHVVADAAVSVLVITGLLLARAFGWVWMDPLAGLIGAAVIASWSFGLIRDTGAILLDMIPDARMAEKLRAAVESGGDTLADLHLWRLGPGHLGVIVSISTAEDRDPAYYRARLTRFRSVSHLTVEVQNRAE